MSGYLRDMNTMPGSWPAAYAPSAYASAPTSAYAASAPVPVASVPANAVSAGADAGVAGADDDSGLWTAVLVAGGAAALGLAALAYHIVQSRKERDAQWEEIGVLDRDQVVDRERFTTYVQGHQEEHARLDARIAAAEALGREVGGEVSDLREAVVARHPSRALAAAVSRRASLATHPATRATLAAIPSTSLPGWAPSLRPSQFPLDVQPLASPLAWGASAPTVSGYPSVAPPPSSVAPATAPASPIILVVPTMGAPASYAPASYSSAAPTLPYPPVDLPGLPSLSASLPPASLSPATIKARTQALTRAMSLAASRKPTRRLTLAALRAL
jgi:hypothetical protein